MESREALKGTIAIEPSTKVKLLSQYIRLAQEDLTASYLLL